MCEIVIESRSTRGGTPEQISGWEKGRSFKQLQGRTACRINFNTVFVQNKVNIPRARESIPMSHRKHSTVVKERRYADQSISLKEHIKTSTEDVDLLAYAENRAFESEWVCSMRRGSANDFSNIERRRRINEFGIDSLRTGKGIMSMGWIAVSCPHILAIYQHIDSLMRPRENSRVGDR